jgi:hypothetical protein
MRDQQPSTAQTGRAILHTTRPTDQEIRPRFSRKRAWEGLPGHLGEPRSTYDAVEKTDAREDAFPALHPALT